MTKKFTRKQITDLRMRLGIRAIWRGYASIFISLIHNDNIVCVRGVFLFFLIVVGVVGVVWGAIQSYILLMYDVISSKLER